MANSQKKQELMDDSLFIPAMTFRLSMPTHPIGWTQQQSAGTMGAVAAAQETAEMHP